MKVKQLWYPWWREAFLTTRMALSTGNNGDNNGTDATTNVREARQLLSVSDCTLRFMFSIHFAMRDYRTHLLRLFATGMYLS